MSEARKRKVIRLALAWGIVLACSALARAEEGLKQDQRLGVLPEDVDPGSVRGLKISADGLHFAYCIEPDDEKGWWFVRDGVRSGNLRESGWYDLSADGKRLAFEKRSDGRSVVVVDDQPGEAFSSIAWLRFSPDSRRVAYVARQGGPKGALWHVVVEGTKSEAFAEEPSSVAFDASGSVLAYLCAAQGKTWLVTNGERREISGRQESGGALFLSPDGKRSAFTFGTNFVVDGTPGDKFQSVHRSFPDPVFSSDSSRFAFTAKNGFDERAFLVVDGRKEQVAGLYVDGLAFSRDGSRFAYTLRVKQGESILVIDGKEQPGSSAFFFFPVFSPDGKRVFCVASGRQGHSFVVDGKPVGRPFDMFSEPPLLSADGRFLRLGVLIGREIWTRVVDLQE